MPSPVGLAGPSAAGRLSAKAITEASSLSRRTIRIVLKSAAGGSSLDAVTAALGLARLARPIARSSILPVPRAEGRGRSRALLVKDGVGGGRNCLGGGDGHDAEIAAPFRPFDGRAPRRRL